MDIRMNQGIKPRPPFGKLLKQKIKQKSFHDSPIFILIESYPWKKTQRFNTHSLVLAFPPHTFPEQYLWEVTGHPVIVLDECNVTTTLLERLSRALLLAQASVVCVQLYSNQLIVYRK